MPMDHAKVPPQLQRFIPIVEKWGAIESDSQRYDFADRAEDNPEDFAELEKFSAAWTREDNKALDSWSATTRLQDSHEYAKFYFTMGLLNELEIAPHLLSSDPVSDLIEQIAKAGTEIKTVNLRRLAIQRLEKYGEAAKRAIPTLENALLDPDLRVQAWAHYMLAILSGDADSTHRQAIQKLSIGPNSHKGLTPEGEALTALKRLDLPLAQRLGDALRSFSILGDLTELKRVAKLVDVNARDHHNSCAIIYAVGNGHLDIVRELLALGADPNSKDPHGLPILHNAAARRKGELMIELLVNHGADIHALDAKGQTALQRAKEYKKFEAIRMLEKLIQQNPRTSSPEHR